jgi:hypothetical protein
MQLNSAKKLSRLPRGVISPSYHHPAICNPPFLLFKVPFLIIANEQKGSSIKYVLNDQTKVF